MNVPDYPLEETLDFKFTSRAFATGIPTTLAGTPAVEIYEDNSVTQITTAETLTVDFDSITGLNNLRVVATAANGFESGKSYQAVISTGTVGGVSVVGEVVAQFSIERSPALRPTTAGRTLDVNATGEAGLDLDNTSGTIDAAQLGADCITAAKIADDALVAANFATGCLTADAFAANALIAATFAAASLDGKGDWNTVTPDAAGVAPTAAENADAVWALDATTQQTQGTFGQAVGDPGATAKSLWQAVVSDAAGVSVSADVIAVKAETALIVADTNELQGDWANAGRLDAILDTIAADTTTDIPALIATAQADLDTITGADGATLATAQGLYAPAKATDVLTQVNAAIDTAITELGVAQPTSTPTLRTGLMLMYMALRNQLKTQTSGTDALEIYNDAGTLICKKLLTDDTSDYVEAKMSSG